MKNKMYWLLLALSLVSSSFFINKQFGSGNVDKMASELKQMQSDLKPVEPIAPPQAVPAGTSRSTEDKLAEYALDDKDMEAIVRERIGKKLATEKAERLKAEAEAAKYEKDISAAKMPPMPSQPARSSGENNGMPPLPSEGGAGRLNEMGRLVAVNSMDKSAVFLKADGTRMAVREGDKFANSSLVIKKVGRDFLTLQNPDGGQTVIRISYITPGQNQKMSAPQNATQNQAGMESTLAQAPTPAFMNNQPHGQLPVQPSSMLPPSGNPQFNMNMQQAR